jgi:GntR family transcriptional regulator/MocR family aminotransferase
MVPSADPPFEGLSELRSEIAAHLRAARGLPADPEDVFVTAGTSEGLALAVHALGLRGRSVAVEDPGYPAARRVLARLGVALEPVPVDEHGLRVDRLLEGPLPAAVLVTPSHQYPRGGILPVDRRLALLAAARAGRAVVLEDDYDSEFRYGVAPLPALAALDPATVVHVGTFSKVLTPWLRAGFLVVPPALRGAFRAVRMDLGTVVSGVQQHALAAYLASGALRRHIARSRRDYAHRRAHLGRLLEAHPVLDSRDSRAGLHAVLSVPRDTDVPALLQGLAEEGILLADLADYAVGGGVQAPAVVLGYGAATTRELDRVIGRLAERCRQAGSS